MSTTPCLNILGFVEGTMERMFFNTNFRHVRVIPVPNGKAVPVSRICNHIYTTYKSTKSNPDHVFVWIDREGRNQNSEEISAEIRETLMRAGAKADGLFVGVADRMTENWFLADQYLMESMFGKYSGYVYEGKNGKHEIKELFRSQGINYKESLHGVDLMKKMRFARASENSESAKSFSSGFSSDCWWMST